MSPGDPWVPLSLDHQHHRGRRLHALRTRDHAPEDRQEAANLLGLCLLCVAVVSGLMVPVLYFGGDAILSLLRAPGPGSYLVLVSPFVFISGVFLALNYWNSRTKHFGRLSVARVTSSLAAALGTGDLPDRRGGGGTPVIHQGPKRRPWAASGRGKSKSGQQTVPHR